MTVTMAALVTAVLLLGVVGLWAASVVAATHRAAASADLAALAAAGTLAAGGGGGPGATSEACRTARRVAAANGARAVSCQARVGGIVDVAVSVPLRLAVPGTAGVVTRSARAGPSAS